MGNRGTAHPLTKSGLALNRTVTVDESLLGALHQPPTNVTRGDRGTETAALGDGRVPGRRGGRQVTSYLDFRQAVRRHAPSELLPYAAAHAARHLRFPLTMSQTWVKGFPPWFYAALARESIVYGNELRDKPVNDRAMIYMRNLFTESHGWPRDGEMNLARLFSGIMYEQFPFQTSVKEELARPYLLFADTEVRERYAFPGPGDWEPVLGGTIEQALSACFVIHVGAARNNGIVDPAWFKADWYQRIEHVLPPASALQILDGLSATPSAARQDGEQANDLPVEYQRYAYNPLVKTPLIDLGTGVRYAPQPHLILTAMTVENLYYRGIQVWNRHQFGAALGARVEAYVGRQLRHSGELHVVSEFHWNKNRHGQVASSDWFIITPQATILVECKSARTNPTQRSGSQRGFHATAETLRKAYAQLDANANEIQTRNPAFNHVPSDRMLIGLVVTAEPFYMANSPEMREMLPKTQIPVLTASLRELEQLVVLPPDILGAALCKLADHPELYTWSLAQSVLKVLPEGYEQPENPLLDQAFAEHVLPILPKAEAVKPT